MVIDDVVPLPQTLVLPPPPQVSGEVQLPQFDTVRGTSQLSLAVSEPQFLPRRAQNAASDSEMQEPQKFFVPAPPHTSGEVHEPQLDTVRWLPQLSVPTT